jgi:DsbC/DsbD-like thiol-disulfide interchange protein
MIAANIVGFLAAMSISAMAGVRSGQATADWLSASTTGESGRPLQTAIRLRLDDGWHTYWRNPGEGGMKTAFEWELPAGWAVSDPGFPPPERFKTGELACFGYSGTVMFPVTVTPPEEFRGTASLKVRVSWLACSDERCVPGDADLALEVTAGSPAETTVAEAVREAFGKTHGPGDGIARLSVSEKPDSLVLTITTVGAKPLDLEKRQVFPVTPEVIDSAAEFRFTRNGSEWTAEVPKNEYAKSPIQRLTLLLSGADAKPIELTWKSS